MIVLVPSRGRPKRAATMAASVRDTARGPVEVVVAVDPDDPELDGYRRLVPNVRVLDERLGYSATLNLLAREAWDRHDILGAFGDDVIFRTAGWDARVAEALASPGLAYPNDLAHGAAWGTAVFMSSSIARALGWLAFPGCHHQYVDNIWRELALELDVWRYLPDVVCEHMHVAYGKAPQDATYASVYSQPQAGLDHAAFLAWQAGGKAGDVERARAAL